MCWLPANSTNPLSKVCSAGVLLLKNEAMIGNAPPNRPVVRLLIWCTCRLLHICASLCKAHRSDYFECETPGDVRLLSLEAEWREAAHRSHDDAAPAGGVCWPEPSLSVWLAAVLSSAWVWFFAVGGTVSRKSSSSPFHFKAKQRKKTLTRARLKVVLRIQAKSDVSLLATGRRLISAVVLMGKSFLLLSLTAWFVKSFF